MTSGADVFVLLLAVCAANAPFLTRRRLFVLPSAGRDKGPGWRLFEIVLLYFIVGAVALVLEARGGQVYPQKWEFYAVTFFLFLVLGYPGFVWRYLWRHRQAES